MPPRRNLQQDYAEGLMVVVGGGAVSHERDTPVEREQPLTTQCTTDLSDDGPPTFHQKSTCPDVVNFTALCAANLITLIT